MPEGQGAPPEATPPSIDDRLMAVMEPSLFKEKAPKEAEEQQDAQPEAEAEPVQSEEEAQPEAEAEAEEEEATEGEEPDGRYVLKHQGQEVKVKFEEMRELAQKGFDYTKKTQELARERQEITQKVQEHIAQTSKQYADQLEAYATALIQTAGAELQNVNWSELAANDPAEYVRLKAKAEMLQGAVMNASRQIQAARQQSEQAKNQEDAKLIQDAAQALQDEGFTVDDYKKVVEGAEKHFGISERGLRLANTDAGLIKALRDAVKFREMTLKKPEVTKQVSAKPPVVKPGMRKAVKSDAGRVSELKRRTVESGGRDMEAVEARIARLLG